MRRANRIGTAALSEEERTKAILGQRMAEADLASASAARLLAEYNLKHSQVQAPLRRPN